MEAIPCRILQVGQDDIPWPWHSLDRSEHETHQEEGYKSIDMFYIGSGSYAPGEARDTIEKYTDTIRLTVMQVCGTRGNPTIGDKEAQSNWGALSTTMLRIYRALRLLKSMSLSMRSRHTIELLLSIESCMSDLFPSQ